MSGELHPWIRDSLIRVAETYGANLTAIPLAEKGKKVQILEVCAQSAFHALKFSSSYQFLTVGAENEVVQSLFFDGQMSDI
jgi:hypothetical protein